MKTRLLAALLFLAAACGKDSTKPEGTQPAEPTSKAENPAASASTRLEISVTAKGFEPDNLSVPSGKPVTLVFTRKTESTCAKEVVIPMDGEKIERKLPLNEAIAIEVTFPKAGEITYACGMDMVKGTVVVQ
ncbi:MAG: cupredoxin domain-containing protein [Deltaproteobacteria bacterium]|nr:cupredoxin domain-containing protein [Deltaproteobacteria bacterium]MDQ3300494.1 cupredoxin domain-containing protein [Myxococcota bacterium]